ncbi:MAG: hypothetical protein EPN94_05660 [Nitrospirae bacterium]|nr:MAG: hypothetical protein EPN94_05660 [Nitrospirota bacterium]
MKKIFGIFIVVMLLALPASIFAGELENLIGTINAQAKADLPGFKADLSAQFGVPVPDVDILVKTLPTPGDVYMTLRIGQIANKPTEVIIKEYKANRGKGWGVIAHRLGIKPGSKEFHALKRGDIIIKGESGKVKGKGKDMDAGKGMDIVGGGKGKGHKK